MQPDRPFPQRTAVVFWGRRGAMAAYGSYVAHALRDTVAVTSVAEGFPYPMPDVAVAQTLRTYDSPRGVITGLPRGLRAAWQLAGAMRREGVDTAVITGGFLWAPLVMLCMGIRCRCVRRVLVVHDTERHQGEALFPFVHQSLTVWMAHGVVVLNAPHFEAATRSPLYRRRNPQLSLLPPLRLDNRLPDFDNLHPLGHVSTPRPQANPAVLFFFGRLSPYKGMDVLAGALRELRSRGVAVVLQMVGSEAAVDVPDDLTASLRVPAGTWISDAELQGLIESADLAVLPYLHATQSGAVANAMAHGLPCAVTPVGGLPDQVGHAGVIARDISAHAFADAVADALDDLEHLRKNLNGVVDEQLHRFHESWATISRSEFEPPSGRSRGLKVPGRRRTS